MSILDNKVVKKYFESGECIHVPLSGRCPGCVALRILKAMEEPIKNGDKYLYVRDDGYICEMLLVANKTLAEAYFKGHYLRLPDQFQPSREKCDCEKHCVSEKHGTCCHCFQCGVCKEFGDNYWLNTHACKKPDPVEEMINATCIRYFGSEHIRKELANTIRELVELARKQ